eukprot:TRINITY_DN1202_c0_g1_i1.p1 TRINITY_DN1202_c0_g1~~TRINITY_DN1202_c0_g1_i1.p1  ORF type:complete len:163 (-),score=95.80 TRINITY_DN1202_c0_g1_i1:176-664(-)
MLSRSTRNVLSKASSSVRTFAAAKPNVAEKAAAPAAPVDSLFISEDAMKQKFVEGLFQSVSRIVKLQAIRPALNITVGDSERNAVLLKALFSAEKTGKFEGLDEASANKIRELEKSGKFANVESVAAQLVKGNFEGAEKQIHPLDLEIVKSLVAKKRFVSYL